MIGVAFGMASKRCSVKGIALYRTRSFDNFGIVKRGREAVRRVDWHPPRPAVSPGKEV